MHSSAVHCYTSWYRIYILILVYIAFFPDNKVSTFAPEHPIRVQWLYLMMKKAISVFIM